MRRTTLLATAIALSFSTVPAAFADGPKSDECGRDQHCTQQETQGNQRDQHSDHKDADKADKKAPSRAAPAQQSRAQPTPAQPSRSQQVAPHQDAKAEAHKAPSRGANGANGPRVTRNDHSKFGPAPRGQEYRSVDDHLVLVDSNTKRIVTVLGLMSSFRN
ncbi:RcnB family protein [Paracoccus sp. JM45]|uniref:RcnB family protein n=1 Tax=Paracoccus sp. JM45 TaxID=2283626 RepID=UPI0011C46E42|nr:RcnB family protein [Paracoccus sp. JM45]